MPAGHPVYVVDDDESVLESVKFLLESFDIPSKLYSTPYAFLQEMGSLDPGCVLTDLRMPSMNGVELSTAVRAKAVGWPIILMSAHLDRDESGDPPDGEFLCLVEKPFTASGLMDALQQAFEQLD